MPNDQKYIPPQPPQLDAPLFASTSNEAGRAAARFAGDRYRQILRALNLGPACIFEAASMIGCFDHQISGRFGELEKALLIEKTGQRKPKPSTGCQCEEYRLTLLGRGVVDEQGLEGFYRATKQDR